MTTKVTAIEIDSQEVWDMICALDPHMHELSFEENLGSFIATNAPEARWCIMTPETVAEYYDHIEPGNLKVKTVQLVK